MTLPCMRRADVPAPTAAATKEHSPQETRLDHRSGLHALRMPHPLNSVQYDNHCSVIKLTLITGSGNSMRSSSTGAFSSHSVSPVMTSCWGKKESKCEELERAGKLLEVQGLAGTGGEEANRAKPLNSPPCTVKGKTSAP